MPSEAYKQDKFLALELIIISSFELNKKSTNIGAFFNYVPHNLDTKNDCMGIAECEFYEPLDKLFF